MDITYFESGYLEDGYFTYTADAISLEVGNANMAVSASVIRSAEATLVVTTTVQVSVYHTEGTSLFAFTNAALAVQVQAIKRTNIAMSSTFSIATDASRQRNISATEPSAFTITIVGVRPRTYSAAVNAAFSLRAVATTTTRPLITPFAYTRTNTGGASGLDGISAGTGLTTYDYYGSMKVDAGPLIEG